MEAPLVARPNRKGSTASTASKARTERGSRTHRGLTCANCRSRKTRCDGTQPTCKTCEVYQDECRYEKPPPMSQIIAMAKRLQEAEQTVADLRRALEVRSPAHAHRSSSSSAAGIVVAPKTDPDASIDVHAVPEAAAPAHLARRHTTQLLPIRSPSREPTSEELLSDLSLDGNGRLCYYGPTSAVHNPPALESQDSPIQTYDEESSKSDVRTLLTSKAIESRAWEEFALGNAALQSDIPRAVVSKLLQIHWAWIAPMFMWVYRPAFMRDMTTNGQYYSPLLLTILCGHAARFHEGKAGEALIARARLLLGAEIHRPSSIPTVQALLQLSARDLAYGQISQAWLYSGMAFRMVVDLGLHHSSGKILSLGHLNAEDLEIRRRLFWSCYFWDKAMSLYLGRLPALIDLPFDPAPELLDDFAEHELWSPYFGESLNLSRISVGEYPPMKSHAISCFESSCKLAVIISDIILQLYSRRGTPDVDGTLKGIRDRLDDWRENSPPHLKYDPDDLPDVSPPPHILTQNLLYFTSIILLHRPFYSAPAHHAACRRASDSLEKLLLMLEKTFGFNRITYLMAYCIYTGASVMVQDVKMGDLEASRKIQTFLRALKQGVTTCPLVQRSLDIILSSLHSTPPYPPPNSIGGTTSASADDGSGSSSHNNNTTAAAAAAAAAVPTGGADPMMARNYLPAFPYRDCHQMDYSNGDPHQVGMDLDAFSLLDCFPENHLDNVNGEWYMPS